MQYEEKLREGLSVALEVSEGKYPGRYQTEIKELTPESITIGVPLHDDQFVPLREGTNIKIYFHDDTSHYCFTSQIIKRIIGFFTIEYPHQIVKVQRREFVRVPIVKELQYQIIRGKQLSEIHKGYMLDLSGGGMLLQTKTEIDQSSLVLLTFKLAKEELQVPAKVIRYTEKGKNNFQVSVEFYDISERKRDKIIAYIFEIQREMRRKGLN